jgi:hypothetical protein
MTTPLPAHTWPPTLSDLKADMAIPSTHTDDDVALANELEAAIAYVVRVRPTFNYYNDITLDPTCHPVPTDDIWSGTVRLAARWFTRHRSPDGMVAMQDLGVGRIAMVDPDIDRKLGLGRFQGPVIA